MTDNDALIEFLEIAGLSITLTKKMEWKTMQNITFDPCLMSKGKSCSHVEKIVLQEFAS